MSFDSVERRIKKHNQFVHDQFERAKSGEVINLTDMMISRERILQETPMGDFTQRRRRSR